MNWWLLPFTLQLYVQSYLLALLTCGTLWWGKPRWHEGFILVKWREWFERFWDPDGQPPYDAFTTTIGVVMGHGKDFWPPARPALWFHKQGHKWQAEDLAVLGDILGGALLVGHFLGGPHWGWALGVYASSGPLWQLPNFLTALRFKGSYKTMGWRTWFAMYRTSEHERSMYAQEAEWRRNGGDR